MARKRRQLNLPNVEEIERLMLDKGLNRERLANQAGISKKTLDKWFNGGEATQNRLSSVARILGVQPSALLKRQEEQIAKAELVEPEPYKSEFDLSLHFKGYVQNAQQAAKLALLAVEITQVLGGLGLKITHYASQLGIDASLLDEYVVTRQDRILVDDRRMWAFVRLKLHEVLRWKIDLDEGKNVELMDYGRVLEWGFDEPDEKVLEYINSNFKTVSDTKLYDVTPKKHTPIKLDFDAE